MFFNLLKPIIILIMLMATAPLWAQPTTLQDTIDKYCRTECITATRLVEVAKKAATSYKVDYRAIMAIVHIESKYHIKAKNGSSVGLSQVLLFYHKGKFKGKNYYDVEDNVFAGMKVFSDCFRKVKGDYRKAFKCYNGGGDKKYHFKAMSTFEMMKDLTHPEVSKDFLGDFIEKKDLL